jgi:hypothetical protein
LCGALCNKRTKKTNRNSNEEDDRLEFHPIENVSNKPVLCPAGANLQPVNNAEPVSIGSFFYSNKNLHMRFITTLLCLHLLTVAYSQVEVGKFAGKQSTPVIEERKLLANYISGQQSLPLLVIDGSVQDYSHLSSLDPTGVASVNILKAESMTNLVSCRIARDVILISTKTAKQRTFKVVDGHSGEGLPGASVTFAESGKEETRLTDDKGLLTMDSLERGSEMAITISCVGYKTVILPFQNNGEFEKLITLERDVRTMKEVVVEASGITRRCGIYCICHTVRRYNWPEQSEQKQESLLFFPTPARAGARVTAVLKKNAGHSVQVKIISLDGRIVYSGERKPVSGRLDVTPGNSLSPGAYIVQVIHPENREMETGKIILQ